jgi:hypothetical protein
MVAKQTYAKKSTLMDVLWDIQKKRRHISHDDKLKSLKHLHLKNGA